MLPLKAMCSSVLASSARRCTATTMRWCTTPTTTTTGAPTPPSHPNLPPHVQKTIDGIELSDAETRRILTTPKDAALPEVLGTDPGNLMPEAFFQEEAVDLGIEFIQEVEAMELPAGELAVVEDLLDCIFDEAADRDAKLLGAIECLKIAKILESDRCTAFLARIAHDALHHFDRRAVLTVAYAHVGPHRILDRLWVMDRDVSLGAVVSLESLKGVVLGSDDAVATVVAELGGKGEDFAAHLYNVSAKRRLKALLKKAFASFAGDSAFAEGAAVKRAMDKVPLPAPVLADWKGRVDKEADEQGRLRWSSFVDALVYES